MTTLQLLGYISAALLLQIVLGIGVAVWRLRGAVVAVSAIEPAETRPAVAGAWPGLRAFRVVRRAYEDLARTQCSFTLEPVDGAPLPTFLPGQFLTFSVLVTNIAGAVTPPRSLVRCYSISDRPRPESYRITIKRCLAPPSHPQWPPGIVSAYFLDHVQQGDILGVRAPTGQFLIDPDPAVPAVLIGGGIGVTPMLSMLHWCMAEQPQRIVHLYYGLRDGAEHVFKHVLEDLAARNPNFHLTVIYARARPEDIKGRDYQYDGFVDVELLRRTLPPARRRFYVCGPPAMMDALVPALAAWGVAEDDINYEAFGPATVSAVRLPKTNASSAFEIRFRRSARTLVWDGQDLNLLDFAERQGLAIEAGCRSGSCGACATKIISGTVRTISKPDIEVTAGACLLCISAPSSALVLEA